MFVRVFVVRTGHLRFGYHIGDDDVDRGHNDDDDQAVDDVNVIDHVEFDEHHIRIHHNDHATAADHGGAGDRTVGARSRHHRVSHG